ncbi:MAG: YajD family HNH nuclease [Syntrophaceae bacterium]|nr:YajD family HNH nuclease [Syntrophaceae bacterium]
MAGIAYGNRGGRLRATTIPGKQVTQRPVEEVVRAMKASRSPGDEAYRERSLVIHGLICGRCGREFSAQQRHLLTVHHKDGNHQNNPPDGSNWENLCVYCHEDVHSRGLLGDYLEGETSAKEEALVYQDGEAEGKQVLGSLAEQLRRALESKKKGP